MLPDQLKRSLEFIFPFKCASPWLGAAESCGLWETSFLGKLDSERHYSISMFVDKALLTKCAPRVQSNSCFGRVKRKEDPSEYRKNAPWKSQLPVGSPPLKHSLFPQTLWSERMQWAVTEEAQRGQWCVRLHSCAPSPGGNRPPVRCSAVSLECRHGLERATNWNVRYLGFSPTQARGWGSTIA